MSADLEGKRCLIVGASSGIGAAVAQRFGALGVHLAVHCNDNRDGAEAVADAIRAAGGSAGVLQGNIADAELAAGLIDKAGEMLGGLDILINNAGSMFGRTAIADATDEQYEDVIALNIGGVFFASRRAAQLMRQQRSGTIINTTSVAARTGGGDGAGLYGSAKGFVSTITRVLAKELAPFGVRVNAVAPGVIRTPFHDRFSTPEQLEAAARGIPMGRLGTAEECVGAYEFLASQRMSGYITGQIIEVNGGQLMP
ncbi:MAG: SDR family oxidoreductase [Devosia nanyangense]|uniref:SDR family oxidoreductase n=1 Tax=Devosia nanyangense TaxID=1228055 RepID=A0A933KZH9_9HYPH|nr:SDR family oxidoreductase [Devosia nanyangense]